MEKLPRVFISDDKRSIDVTHTIEKIIPCGINALLDREDPEIKKGIATCVTDYGLRSSDQVDVSFGPEVILSLNQRKITYHFRPKNEIDCFPKKKIYWTYFSTSIFLQGSDFTKTFLEYIELGKKAIMLEFAKHCTGLGIDGIHVIFGAGKIDKDDIPTHRANLEACGIINNSGILISNIFFVSAILSRVRVTVALL